MRVYCASQLYHKEGDKVLEKRASEDNEKSGTQFFLHLSRYF